MKHKSSKKSKPRSRAVNPFTADKLYHTLHQKLPHFKKAPKRAPITRPETKKPPVESTPSSHKPDQKQPVYGSAPSKPVDHTPSGVIRKKPVYGSATSTTPNPSTPSGVRASRPSGVRNYRPNSTIWDNKDVQNALWELGKRGLATGAGAIGGYLTGGPAGAIAGARTGYNLSNGALPALPSAPTRPQITYPNV
jgi:hypothetical protein